MRIASYSQPETGIWIDQIPLSSDHGVEFANENQDWWELANPDWWEPWLIIVYLTKRDADGAFRRVRELPRDAHVEVDNAGEHLVFQNGEGTWTRKVPR